MTEFSFTNIRKNYWGAEKYHVAMWAPAEPIGSDSGCTIGIGLSDDFVAFYASHGIEIRSAPAPFCMYKNDDNEAVVFAMVECADLKTLTTTFYRISEFVDAAPSLQEMVEIYRDLMTKIPNNGFLTQNNNTK